jgi:dynein assembly factor with WDR repeat domains 1
LWNVENGSLISTYRGHTAEIVCLCFDPMSFFLVTGSMDKTAILWNLETEQQIINIDVKTNIILFQF